ncbi:MAG: hypothetical protein IPL53_15120 [Ignavibacteria bacterium]|nr:hypothetical protein [Ignavibacteria bacterium]
MSGQRVSNIAVKKLKPEPSEKIIEFEMREIMLKEKEVELQKKESDNNFHYAKESLKYQLEDYKDIRKQETTKKRMTLLVVFISVFMFFTFLMAAMFLDKDEILADIIKVAGYVFGGGITGYGLGVQNKRDRDKQAV